MNSCCFHFLAQPLLEKSLRMRCLDVPCPSLYKNYANLRHLQPTSFGRHRYNSQVRRDAKLVSVLNKHWRWDMSSRNNEWAMGQVRLSAGAETYHASTTTLGHIWPPDRVVISSRVRLRGANLTTNLHLILRLRMAGAITSLHICFDGVVFYQSYLHYQKSFKIILN